MYGYPYTTEIVIEYIKTCDAVWQLSTSVVYEFLSVYDMHCVKHGKIKEIMAVMDHSHLPISLSFIPAL